MIKYYFGSPGAGKTTHAVKFAFKNKKKYRNCVTNFENTVTGVHYDNMDDLGKYRYPDNTLVVIDEAGVKYNNRKYKSFSDFLISYFKYHRHYKNDISVYSQSWEDIDITIRRLTDELWYLKKIGPFTVSRKVKKFVAINSTDYQIIDGYKFESLIWQILPFPFHKKVLDVTYRPMYYKYFDSYNDPHELPIYDFTNQSY